MILPLLLMSMSGCSKSEIKAINEIESEYSEESENMIYIDDLSEFTLNPLCDNPSEEGYEFVRYLVQQGSIELRVFCQVTDAYQGQQIGCLNDEGLPIELVYNLGSSDANRIDRPYFLVNEGDEEFYKFIPGLEALARIPIFILDEIFRPENTEKVVFFDNGYLCQNPEVSDFNCFDETYGGGEPPLGLYDSATSTILSHVENENNSTIIHEFGHAYDQYISPQKKSYDYYHSNSIEFTKPFNEHFNGPIFGSLYESYFNKPEEYFAQSFALYLCAQSTHEALMSDYPKTFSYIQNLIYSWGIYDLNTP